MLGLPRNLARFDRVPFIPDPAIGWRLESHGEGCKRGFSRAVGSHNGEPLLLMHVQVYLMQDLFLAICQAYIFPGKEMFLSWSSGWSGWTRRLVVCELPQ